MVITARIQGQDSDGKSYLILQWQTRVDTSSSAEASEYGPPEYRLQNGKVLTAIDEDTFKLVESGKILKRKT
jgi:hypothetical protein